MVTTNPFESFMPGFDFLKSFAQANPHAAMPTAAQWVTPTLDPDELDKRIQDLKSVQFWLDQNAKALSATIQALEVQRMTLSTLQSMNVGMADVAAASDTGTSHTDNITSDNTPTITGSGTPGDTITVTMPGIGKVPRPVPCASRSRSTSIFGSNALAPASASPAGWKVWMPAPPCTGTASCW